MPNLMGQHLGNYQLIGLLGRGGFGEVHLGRHLHLNAQQAAIKVLTGRMTPKEIQEFTNEAQILARLSHPNILRVIDFGVQNNVPFLVIEFAPNGTLRDRHQRGSILLFS